MNERQLLSYYWSSYEVFGDSAVVNDVWMIDDFMFCGGRIDKYHVVFLLNTSDKQLEIDVDLRIGCFCYPSCYSRPAKRLRK